MRYASTHREATMSFESSLFGIQNLSPYTALSFSLYSSDFFLLISIIIIIIIIDRYRALQRTRKIKEQKNKNLFHKTTPCLLGV